MRGSTTRRNQYIRAFNAYATAYNDFAIKTKEKAIDPKGVDPAFARWVHLESIVLEAAGKSYKELASAVAQDKMANGAFAQYKVERFKHILEALGSMYDEFRLNLAGIYERDFPTAEQAAAEEASAVAKNGKNGAAAVKHPLHKRPNAEDETGYRIWTTASETFQVEAKYMGCRTTAKRCG